MTPTPDAPSAITPSAEPRLSAQASASKEAPWHASTVSYGHSFSALSLSKAAEPFYNPYYEHHLALDPEWALTPALFARGHFELSQELTIADDTRYTNEVVASDVSLDFGTRGRPLPLAGLKLGGNVRVVLPLSKLSQAQTKLFSVAPALSLSRTFPVLDGLTLGYDARYTQRFHLYTTAQLSGPSLPSCGDARSDNCAEFLHDGIRNVHSDLSHGPSLRLLASEKVSIFTRFTFSQGWLYPLTELPASLAASQSLSTEGDASIRRKNRFTVEGTWQFLRQLSLTAGVDTYSAQTGADGLLRTPFFNRYTTVYLDLGFGVETAISKI